MADHKIHTIWNNTTSIENVNDNLKFNQQKVDKSTKNNFLSINKSTTIADSGWIKNCFNSPGYTPSTVLVWYHDFIFHNFDIRLLPFVRFAIFIKYLPNVFSEFVNGILGYEHLYKNQAPFTGFLYTILSGSHPSDSYLQTIKIQLFASQVDNYHGYRHSYYTCPARFIVEITNPKNFS